MIAGTGGTTGRPKGVMLTGRNVETMAALTLMSYPFAGSPVYLAFAPLTHAAGVLCFPIMALGGEIVIMPHPDLGEFLALIGRHRVTHAFLPPTVIYSLLDHPALASADLGSLQCLWYGAAPMSAARLEQAIGALGPVLGQLFGQTEAPMFISALPPGGPPARRRDAGDRAVHLGRPPHPADHRGDHGRGGAAAAAGGARRDRGPRPAGDGGLLQEPGRHRRGVQARLAPHRRRRLPRPRRLPVHRRPAQGHDHHRRLQRLLDRGRAGGAGPPGRARLRGRRAARRQVGRARHRDHPAARRPATSPPRRSGPGSRTASAA